MAGDKIIVVGSHPIAEDIISQYVSQNDIVENYSDGLDSSIDLNVFKEMVLFSLLLMEINPEAQDTLLARGYMYGESRIVAGYHWASDVEAGRLAASAAYAKLHTSNRFLKQMARAKKEFRKKHNQKWQGTR